MSLSSYINSQLLNTIYNLTPGTLRRQIHRRSHHSDQDRIPVAVPGRGCRRRLGGRCVQRRHAKVLGRRSLDQVQFRRDRKLAREVDGLGGVGRVPRLLRQVQEHEGTHVRRFCQVIKRSL